MPEKSTSVTISVAIANLGSLHIKVELSHLRVFTYDFCIEWVALPGIDSEPALSVNHLFGKIRRMRLEGPRFEIHLVLIDMEG